MPTPSQDTRVAQGASKSTAEEKLDARCDCGNLMAKVNEDGLEIKCRRCKRLVIIPGKIDHEYMKLLQRRANSNFR